MEPESRPVPDAADALVKMAYRSTGTDGINVGLAGKWSSRVAK